MATLYLDQQDLELRADGKTLAFYESGERRGTVPLSFLDRVVIKGGRTRLDSGVLMKIAEAGATTVLVSPRIGNRVAIILGPAHNDAAVRLAQARRVFDEAYCRDFALRLVTAKLRRQRQTMTLALRDRPDARRPLFDAVAAIDGALEALKNRESATCATIRGIEGAAARTYIKGLAAVFPPSARFSGRNRRPPRDPVNVCLSLAYTLLHVDAVRAAYAAGIDPLLGFYHRPAFGRESLACDLIEPLRPHADAWVWQMWRARVFREDHYTTAGGACLIGKAGRERFYQQWEGQAGRYRRWMRRMVASLARTLREEGEPLLALAEEEEP